jgi:raffinose/stachyose/melibiose transport system substrate-binding protein
MWQQRSDVALHATQLITEVEVMLERGKAVWAGATMVLTALAFTACGGSTPTNSGTASAATCTGIGNITLNVWADSNDQPYVDPSTKAFEQKYPNVTVNIAYKDFDTMIKTVGLAMTSNNPPDIAAGNQGYQVDGTLVKSGAILNLDQYFKALGWDKAFSANTLQPNRLTTDGKQFGTGSLYGLSLYVQYVGVFYNKSKLAALGITDPSSLDSKDAFEAALAKAKAAGMTPIMMGDLTTYPATHNYALMQSWYVSAQDSNDWVYGKAGTTFDDAGHRSAAADLQNWGKSGYFNTDRFAIKNGPAAGLFANGSAVFDIDGDWQAAAIDKGLGQQAGWMLFPAGPDGKHGAVGSVSEPYHISSKSKHPGCAATYLDFITTSDAAKAAMVAQELIPAASGGTAAPTSNSALMTDQINEYARLLKDNGLMAWEDWSTPTMLTLLGQNTQSLIAGKMTPADYTKSIQANWQAFQDTRK